MPITFTKVKLPHGWLGNMAPYPVVYGGETWKTTEALFQALRFDDARIRAEIRDQKSPMSAKMVAKKNWAHMVVKPKSAKDLDNMEMVLRLKLEQHPELKELLLATGDEEIIEDVTNRPGVDKEYALEQRHTFWGAALRDSEWVGLNFLGKIWMKLRGELRGAQ